MTTNLKASMGKVEMSIGAGLYMTANVPLGCPLYLLAIVCNCWLYATCFHLISIRQVEFITIGLPSDNASIFSKFAAELEQEHSFVFSNMPLGTQYA